MPDLEQQLTQLAGALDWPATPNLRTRVRNQLVTSPSAGVPAPKAREWPSAGWGRWVGDQRRWALAAAALIVAAAALVAYTPTREAIAGWINVHTIFIRVQHPPTPSPLPPGPIGTRLGLGGKTTLVVAQEQLKWHLEVPTSLGQPDEVYLQSTPAGPAQGEVTLVYAARPDIPVSAETGVGVLITEARGTVDQGMFGKMLGPDTTLEQVTVAGHQGYWIAGKPHDFFFIDADGNFRNETMRLAGNTLIIDYNGTVIRIEGNLTKAQAVQIATSLR